MHLWWSHALLSWFWLNNSNFKWGENCFHSKELQLTLNETSRYPHLHYCDSGFDKVEMYSHCFACMCLLRLEMLTIMTTENSRYWNWMFQSCSQVWHESMTKRPSFQTPIRWTVGDLPGHNRLWQLQVALPLNLLFAWPYRQSVPLGSDWAPACPFKMCGE